MVIDRLDQADRYAHLYPSFSERDVLLDAVVGVHRMMEGRDLVAELLRQVDHRGHLVAAMAMAVEAVGSNLTRGPAYAVDYARGEDYGRGVDGKTPSVKTEGVNPKRDEIGEAQ